MQRVAFNVASVWRSLDLKTKEEESCLLIHYDCQGYKIIDFFRHIQNALRIDVILHLWFYN